jgi:hypothetical protein
MLRRLGWMTVLVAILIPLTVAAAKPKPTAVSIRSWSAETTDGAKHAVKPNKTYRACASAPVTALVALGTVSRAKSGKAFKENWSLNGKRDSVFNVAWSKSGGFKDSFGIGASGALSTGHWTLKLVQGGRTIGSSAVTIKTKPGC